MSILKDLRRQLGSAVDELNKPEIISDGARYATVEAQVADLEAQIERATRAQSRSASLARPAGAALAETGAEPTARDLEQERRSIDEVGGVLAYRRSLGAALSPNSPTAHLDYLSVARRGLGYTQDRSKNFRSFGEQLQAVAAYYSSRGSDTDSRLVKADTAYERAPSGGTEVDPTGGGFLVQVDFSAATFMLMHDLGELLSRVSTLSISSASNGIKIPGVDETSRADGSRWGGVSSTWVGEGTTVTPTKPKFRLIELDLKKLISTAYVTSEILQDAGTLAQIYQRAFAEELMFKTEDAIWNGDGVGKPLGILNSDALISVAKVSGQTTKTVVKENVDAMYSRCWARSRKNASWFINQDVEPTLQGMGGIVGSAGDLVYMPPGGLSAAPYGTLKGRPVLNIEYAQTVGTPGDIVLADMSQYQLADKGGVQAATSMHVAFLTDEMAFRFTYRVDGKPLWSKVLTPKNGTNTLSPFVALATR